MRACGPRGTVTDEAAPWLRCLGAAACLLQRSGDARRRPRLRAAGLDQKKPLLTVKPMMRGSWMNTLLVKPVSSLFMKVPVIALPPSAFLT